MFTKLELTIRPLFDVAHVQYLRACLHELTYPPSSRAVVNREGEVPLSLGFCFANKLHTALRKPVCYLVKSLIISQYREAGYHCVVYRPVRYYRS